MNGYCEYHAFDRAVDVCNVCYGDLCRTCAVMLAGRRHATCKECVIDLSGVRTLARPVERGDRATVKARREQYSSVDEDEYFQYFIASAESERSTEAEPAPERRRGRFRFGRNRSSTQDDHVEMAGPVSNDGVGIQNPEPAGHSEFHQKPRPAKSATRLDRLRRSLHPRETEAGEGTLAQPTTTNADEKAADRPEVYEELPDPALAMSAASSTPEPLTEPEDEPVDAQAQPRSLASQPAATDSWPTSQKPEHAVLESIARGDARQEPEQFEPADLSVDPFEIAGTRSFEAPVLRYRPQPAPPTPNTHTPAPQPPKPAPPADDTDAEGRWIPPALRGVDSDTTSADVEPTRRP